MNALLTGSPISITNLSAGIIIGLSVGFVIGLTQGVPEQPAYNYFQVASLITYDFVGEVYENISATLASTLSSSLSRIKQLY